MHNVIHLPGAQGFPVTTERATVGPAADEAALDLLLVERVRRGEKRAFDLLVLKYQHRVLAVINRLVNDIFEAEDVAQETFVRAYRAIDSFRGDSAFYTWLYRIAVNAAKNHLAGQGRRPRTSDLDPGDAEQYDIDSALKDRATPEHEARRVEIQNTIVATLAQLPKELRTAIVLREVDGLSYEEIAQVMECPIGTVRSRIFRAREALDQSLKPLVGSDEND